MAQDLNRRLIKEDVRIASEHMKRCFLSCVVGKMQIKATTRCQLILTGTAKTQTPTAANAGEDAGRRGRARPARGDAAGRAGFGRRPGGFSQNSVTHHMILQSCFLIFIQRK